MSKRFIILIVAFVFALTNSYRSESKDVIHVPSEVIEIAPDELHEESPVNSDYGIARQNSFSAPIRNLQPVQKRSGGTSIQKSIIKSGKNLCRRLCNIYGICYCYNHIIRI